MATTRHSISCSEVKKVLEILKEGKTYLKAGKLAILPSFRCSNHVSDADNLWRLKPEKSVLQFLIFYIL